MKRKELFIFILSLIGLGVTAYLAYEYNFAATVGCPIAGKGCDIVRDSVYSKFFGISIPFLGLAFYIVVAGLSILLIEAENKLLKQILFLTSLSGFLFSLYLTFLEAFVINAYCFWCVSSAIVSTLIFILSIILLSTRQKITESDKTV